MNLMTNFSCHWCTLQSLKSEGVKTFGEYADLYVSTVWKKALSYDRIDVVFDRYRSMSIKSTTRNRRSKNVKPVRRSIVNRHVPMPHNWQNFLALAENKADLAMFLSEELIRQSPEGNSCCWRWVR